MLTGGLAIVAVMWGILLADMDLRFERERQDGDRQLLSLVQLGAMELKASLDLIDLTLRDLRDQWQSDPGGFAAAARRRAQVLYADQPPLVTVQDERGRTIFPAAASGASLPVDTTASGSHPVQDQLTVHPPRWDGERWQVDFCRPILARNGQPTRAVVRVSVPVEKLARSFPVIYQGDGSALTVVREDDAVILRQIEPPDGTSVPPVDAEKFKNRPVFSPPPELRRATHGVGQRINPGTTMPRTFAWQHVEGYPLTLLVSEPSALVYRDVSTYQTRYLAGGVMASIVLMLGAYGLGQWISTRERARRQLQHSLRRLRRGHDNMVKSREALRRLSAHQTQVREQERKRIAAEVHDDLGQRLTVLRMDLAMLPRSLPQDQRVNVGPAIEHLLSGIDQIMAQVRGLVRQLRPPGLDISLASAVEALVEEFEAGLGIPVHLTTDLEGQAPVGDAQATAAYRLLQEALTNIARHSDARKIQVHLSASDEGLRLRVQDDGRGFDTTATTSGGFGLTGMRERVHALGGQLGVVSRPGQGTVIDAVLPLGANEPIEMNSLQSVPPKELK